MVSYINEFDFIDSQNACLNPYCSGRWSRTTNAKFDGFVRHVGLNPYCSGRWSRTNCSNFLVDALKSLNPYCSGRWSRTSTL